MASIQTFDSSGMSPNYERSIPLEEEYEEGTVTSPLAGSRLSGKAMDDEITRLKTASSNKFKQKWEQILEKYAAINDDLESDEIDLETGKITIDNGHLRSMAPKEIEVGGVIVNGDIWAEDDSYDKAYNDHRRVQLHQEKLRKKFDSHIQRHKESSPPKRVDAPDDNLYRAFSSPTKSGRSLTRESLSLSTSEASELSDAVNSPFKTSRMGSLPSSPLKSSFHAASPSKRTKLSDPPHWYNCAFEYCSFLAEEKRKYEEHLLSTHPHELSYIGYPVAGDANEVKKYISELCVRKLGLYFPLAFDNTEQSISSLDKCPILGCKFMSIKGHSLKSHLQDKHSKKTPNSGLPPQATNTRRQRSLSKVKSPLISFNASEPNNKLQLDIPKLVIKDVNSNNLDTISSSASSIGGVNSLKNQDASTQKDESGYDSIDEFFND